MSALTADTSSAAPIIDLGDGPVFGVQLEPQEAKTWCSELQQLGVETTTFWIRWNQVEPEKGRYQWDRIDAALTLFQECGIEDIGVHINTEQSWGTLPAPEQWRNAMPSMPPANMDDYYDLIFNLVSHLKGRVSRYSIENEAAAEPVWPSSAESYFELLDTAYRAAKAADPEAIVVDSGTASGSLGIYVTHYNLKSGQSEAALRFANEFFVSYKPREVDIPLSNQADLQELVNNPIPQRILEWMPLLLSNHNLYEVVQIHYYGPWDKLATVMGWLRDELQASGVDKPIEIWELGYGWQNPTTYNQTAHAQDTVKLLVTAAGEGSPRIIYWRFGHTSKGWTPGLATENELLPAGIAYGVTTQMLRGVTSAQRLDLGVPGVWGYRFGRSKGDLYVIWSTEPTIVSLPMDAIQVIITDISGNTSMGNSEALAVGVSPIFVEAESD